MKCTPEEQFDFTVSLLQGDAHNWWETVSNATVRSPIRTYADFVRGFRDRFMPNVQGDKKLQDFLNLRQGTMSVTDYEV